VRMHFKSHETGTGYLRGTTTRSETRSRQTFRSRLRQWNHPWLYESRRPDHPQTCCEARRAKDVERPDSVVGDRRPHTPSRMRRTLETVDTGIAAALTRGRTISPFGSSFPSSAVAMGAPSPRQAGRRLSRSWPQYVFWNTLKGRMCCREFCIGHISVEEASKVRGRGPAPNGRRDLPPPPIVEPAPSQRVHTCDSGRVAHVLSYPARTMVQNLRVRWG
jgi:hypothetical protein